MITKMAPHSIALFRCEFCGTVHTSIEEATGHGCVSGPNTPPRHVEVGSKVVATFEVGAGMEAVGTKTTAGTVVDIKSPAELYPKDDLSTKARRFGGFNTKFIGLQAPYHHHDWMILVKPDNERVVNGMATIGTISETWFPQGQISFSK